MNRRMEAPPWTLLDGTETPGTPDDLVGQGANLLPGQAGRNYMACSFQRLCVRNKRVRDQFKNLKTLVWSAASTVGQRDELLDQAGMRQS
jgi:hypothetical protein